MPEPTLHDIAPRLARARDAEVAYRRKRAEQRRQGYVSIDVMAEEMTRGLRRVTRAYVKALSEMRLAPIAPHARSRHPTS
jgi:hypothetical protein